MVDTAGTVDSIATTLAHGKDRSCGGGAVDWLRHRSCRERDSLTLWRSLRQSHRERRTHALLGLHRRPPDAAV